MDTDPWGNHYRIVTRKLGRQPPGIAAIGREGIIAEHLFPAHPPITWAEVPFVPIAGGPPQLTIGEMVAAAARL